MKMLRSVRAIDTRPARATLPWKMLADLSQGRTFAIAARARSSACVRLLAAVPPPKLGTHMGETVSRQQPSGVQKSEYPFVPRMLSVSPDADGRAAPQSLISFVPSVGSRLIAAAPDGARQR